MKLFLFKLKTKTSFNNNDANSAYYYIDDVSLEPIQAKDFSPCKIVQYFTQIANKPAFQQAHVPIILENINFESGKSEIKQESFPYLDSLVLYLEKNNYIIQIIGYTDNVGNEKSNQILSENRAKAIVEYLISKGITSSRLSAKAISAKPLASNRRGKSKK